FSSRRSRRTSTHDDYDSPDRSGSNNHQHYRAQGCSGGIRTSRTVRQNDIHAEDRYRPVVQCRGPRRNLLVRARHQVHRRVVHPASGGDSTSEPTTNSTLSCP
ncbi:hypothetical protein L914_11341, partial [Phytophthora nicotianae]